VITGEELTADDVRTYGAELVVVATGSNWSANGSSVYGELGGRDDPRVVTPEQVLDGLPDGDVAVVDCEGYLTGAACAELALGLGRRVAYHAPFDRVGPLLDETLEAHVLRSKLHAAGLEMAPLPGGVAELEAGAVVLVTQRHSDDALYHALLENPGDVEGVYRVGDCVAPRILADAIFDGHRLAREIDGEDPAVPRVWKRERAAL